MPPISVSNAPGKSTTVTVPSLGDSGVRDTKVEIAATRVEPTDSSTLSFIAFVCVHRVRQEKPGRSRGMKGAHHVNYPFDM
jgi:hypothetical protein